MTRRKKKPTVPPGRKANAKAMSRTPQRRHLGPVVLVAAGALIVAAAIAILATGGNDEPQAVPPAHVRVTGESLPPFAEGEDPAVGMPAPTLQGEDFEGAPMTIGDDRRPKAIVFLAHWCPHCQREVPLIQNWLETAGAPEGVDLYSVATSIDPSEPNYPPDAWLHREGWTVPVLVDDSNNSAATAYGLTAFPYFVFVDAEGTVVARTTGEITIEQLQGYLASTMR